MNSSVWAVWAAQGSKEKKVDLSFSEQLLRVFFSTFCGQNFFEKNLHIIAFMIFFDHKKLKKIGCHSCFYSGCNTERGI